MGRSHDAKALVPVSAVVSTTFAAAVSTGWLRGAETAWRGFGHATFMCHLSLRTENQ